MMALRRYLPEIVLVVMALLYSAGVPEDLIRVPGLLALAASMLVWIPAEAESARSERRNGQDRRQNGSST